MGTKPTLYEALQQSVQQHNADHGVQNMVVRNIGMACPLCTHAEVPLMQNPANRSIYCSGPVKHEWHDTEELRAHNPQKLSNAPPPPLTPQPNHTTIQVSIPNQVVEGLNARFGTRMSASAGAVLSALVQPGSYVVSADDGDRLSKLLGMKIPDGQALCGAVYAIFTERNQLRATMEEIARGTPAAVAMGGELAVEVDADTRRIMQEKATGAGKTLSKYLGENIIYAVKQGWF